MTPLEISALITIRAYTNNLIDNTRVRLTRDQVNALEDRIVDFDKRIVAEIINISFDDKKNASPVEFGPYPKKKV